MNHSLHACFCLNLQKCLSAVNPRESNLSSLYKKQHTQPLLVPLHINHRVQRARIHPALLAILCKTGGLPKAAGRALVLIQPQLLMIHRETGSCEVEGQHDLKLADWMLKITLCQHSRHLCLFSVFFKDGALLL